MTKFIDVPYAEGWIYVCMTARDPNRFKIGLSESNPLIRMRAFKTADPYIALNQAYCFLNTFGRTLKGIEDYLHSHRFFCDSRIHFLGDENQESKPSEWFSGDPRDVMASLESALSEIGFDITNPSSEDYSPYKKRAIRFYDCDLIMEEPDPFALELIKMFPPERPDWIY